METKTILFATGIITLTALTIMLNRYIRQKSKDDKSEVI